MRPSAFAQPPRAQSPCWRSARPVSKAALRARRAGGASITFGRSLLARGSSWPPTSRSPRAPLNRPSAAPGARGGGAGRRRSGTVARLRSVRRRPRKCPLLLCQLGPCGRQGRVGSHGWPVAVFPADGDPSDRESLPSGAGPRIAPPPVAAPRCETASSPRPSARSAAVTGNDAPGPPRPAGAGPPPADRPGDIGLLQGAGSGRAQRRRSRIPPARGPVAPPSRAVLSTGIGRAAGYVRSPCRRGEVGRSPSGHGERVPAAEPARCASTCRAVAPAGRARDRPRCR